ncbi:hypothetical protein NL676_032006 [Syzygium grande]|nr:hypothetical protein NL676_032006 [Syzygium grande]
MVGSQLAISAVRDGVSTTGSVFGGSSITGSSWPRLAAGTTFKWGVKQLVDSSFSSEQDRSNVTRTRTASRSWRSSQDRELRNRDSSVWHKQQGRHGPEGTAASPPRRRR